MPSPESRLSNATNTSHGISVEQNRFLNNSNSLETVFVWNQGPHPVILRGNPTTGTGTMYFAGPKPEEKDVSPPAWNH